MKSHPNFIEEPLMLKSPRSSQGFTLIELLVVITIIAILAGLAFPAITGAMKAAKKAQAGVMVNQLKTALTAYQTEYGRWPTTTFTTESSPVESNNSALFDVLRGQDSSGSAPAENPRKIPFMEFNTKDLINPASPTGFQDPWKKTYKIILDVDYDNKITGLPKKKAADPTTINASIAIWSNATKEDTVPDPNKDLVSSW